MDVQEVINQARDAMNVRQVYGEPIHQGDVTIIPAARVRGGAGGGGGDGPQGQGSGSGFGLMASPAGMYVLRNGDVKWRPAVDLNRVVMGIQLVAITGLFVLRALLTRRRR
jgi:uncharacterized spore protein YtfJ